MPRYVIKVAGSMWHVFPDAEVAQDRNMSEFKNKRMFKVRYLAQKDGSRFKCLYEGRSGFITQQMIERIREYFPKQDELYTTIEHDYDRLMQRIKRGVVGPHNHVFRVYRTHKFLNGERFFPVIIHHDSKTVYDAACLFPDKVPEDDLGVFAESEDELTLGLSWKPEVVDYQSFIRLCPCCNVVSDTSKPLREPWLSKKNL